MGKKVKVKIVYGGYCANGCSMDTCFVRREQDKVHNAILVEGEDRDYTDSDCAYWSNNHRPKTTHAVVTTDNDKEHVFGQVRFKIIEDTIVKKVSPPKKITPKLNKKDFNNQLKDLI